MWKIEGLFAEAKQKHNLSRAKYRGTSKVQIQAYLSATAQNLKRLVCLVYVWYRMLRAIARLPRVDDKARTHQMTTFSTGPKVFWAGA